MAKRSPRVEPDDVPVLPAFASEAWDVTVIFNDDTTEIIKTLAKGQAAAIRTAGYTIERWPADKISKIIGLGVERP